MTQNTNSRLIVVDFARVMAILFMIQGHALDVLLAPAYRQGALFDSWLFLRGLTAPMFFTLCGVSFALASLKRWDSYTHVSPPLFRRLRRFGFFVLLGYAMHLPVKSFRNFQYLDAAGWEGGLQVDVLQCIGVTLMFLQMLVYVAGTPARFAKLAAGVAASVVLFAPVVWAIQWAKFLPLSIASYFNAQTGSLFPLFPWSGFVLFGSALGYVFVQRNWISKSLPVRPLAVGGAAVIALGLFLAVISPAVYGSMQLWKVNPGFFAIRAGSVCVLLALLSWVTRGIRMPQRAIQSIAQESLVVYFVHICFLYGSIWNGGLRQVIGATLLPLPTLAYICTLLISMLLLAWTWNWYKRTQPAGGLLVRSAVFLLAIGYGLQ